VWRNEVWKWKEEDRLKQEAEENLYGERRWGMRWADDAMDVDKEDLTDNFSEESEDDEDDTPEVKALKVMATLSPREFS